MLRRSRPKARRVSTSDWDELEPPQGTPRAHTENIAVGTLLWRVHSADPGRGVDTLNPTIPKPPYGGRFDCPSAEHHYSYSYFGDTSAVALLEVIGRSLRPSTRPRIVRRTVLEGKVLSQVRVVQPIPVALLHGSHLHHIGQTTRLTKTPSRMYPITRLWSSAVLRGTADAQGLKYRSRHDEDQFCYLLTGSKDTTLESIEAVERIDLESPAGIVSVKHELLRYNAVLI